MNLRKIAEIILGALLLLSIGVVLLQVWGRELTIPQAWQSLGFALLGAGVLLLGRQVSGAPVAALLLLSLSASFSRLNPSEVQVLSDRFGVVLAFLWTALLFIFPYAFLHLSLSFPVAGRWLSRGSWRIGLLYAPHLLLLCLTTWVPSEEVGGFLTILSIPVGFLIGIGILFRQFLRILTVSEKNRLRVLLIGCLAGGLPRLLTALLVDLPAPFLDLADLLLPIFPLSLTIALLKRNFSEFGRGFQRLLMESMAFAGTFNVLLASYWLLSRRLHDPGVFDPATLLGSAVLALLSLFPFRRWGRSYVSTHFDWDLPLAALARPPERFRTIRPNPYIVGNPVRSSHMFFGRKEEFRFLRRMLQTEKEGCVVVLHGQRRSGKTSILYQVASGRLGEGFVPIFIDMQGVVVDGDAAFLQMLADAIHGGLSSSGRRGSQRPGRIDGHARLVEYLEGLLARPDLLHKRLVLLIDEYELIETKAERQQLSPDIYPYLSSLLQRFPRLSYVFTGSRPLRPDSPWAPILSRSAFRKVDSLTRPDVRDLVCQPLANRVGFEPEVLSLAWRLAAGNPFFTQLLCQNLVDLVNEKRTPVVSASLLEKAVERILQNPPPQLLYLWSGFKPTEKLGLSALATLLKSPTTFLAPQRVERLLRTLPERFREGLDGLRIRMLFEELREQSVLDRDQTRYRFTMDLMRRWVRSERNVWNVLNEIQPTGTRGGEQGPTRTIADPRRDAEGR